MTNPIFHPEGEFCTISVIDMPHNQCHVSRMNTQTRTPRITIIIISYDMVG
ncbi:hypothetical protein [Vibrio navarrensis]|uniref:hypothetical protein n=1 Tax=Vibrio navarrensis TaxID=29495 RepID=UPI00186A17FB|nr:hypothetical protein [Vibrio navarrensis]